jgi:hypothetical protein
LPGGDLGRAIARYFGEDPSQQLDDELRFKQAMETGEVVRSNQQAVCAKSDRPHALRQAIPSCRSGWFPSSACTAT